MDRMLFVSAGQIVPRSTMAGTVSYPYAEYSPSLVEIGIMVGAVAFVAFVYTLAERYLDMGEGDVHVFWNFPWIKQPRHQRPRRAGRSRRGRRRRPSCRTRRGRRRAGGGRGMIRRAMARYAYPTTVLLLVAGIFLVGGFLAMVAVPDLVRTAAVASPAAGTTASAGSTTSAAASATASASASPSPSPTSAMALSPIGIAIPANADCNACHVTTTGQIGVKDIPVLGHPLKGFADCTACHNPAGLVKTAPGHDSLHEGDCLVCHQENPNAGTASVGPMRPEHMGTDKPCTSCHGVDQHAPLPSDMAGRGDNCWICHNGPEFQYLFNSASPGAPAPNPTATLQAPTTGLLNPPATTPPAP